MTAPTLAPATLARFVAYAGDAQNWSGTPLVGGNVGGEPADKGYLLHMKKAGLITTWEERMPGEAPDVWIDFTDKGVALAAEHGIDLAAS
tara:strand:+ start:187 stop:456 length:270 start_codon:yes stop_codon:yes gene_type:complete